MIRISSAWIPVAVEEPVAAGACPKAARETTPNTTQKPITALLLVLITILLADMHRLERSTLANGVQANDINSHAVELAVAEFACPAGILPAIHFHVRLRERVYGPVLLRRPHDPVAADRPTHATLVRVSERGLAFP